MNTSAEIQETPDTCPDDTVIDRRIGLLLHAGVYSAALVILAGATFFLVKHGGDRPNYRSFHSLPVTLRSPAAIVRAALHGNSESIIQLGLLLLIATPVARVVFSVIAFLLRRDFLYVIISAIVLAVLMCSLIHH